MSSKPMIDSALTLSHEIPLFDYNVNFQGLKKLLESFNITLNQQKDSIQKLKLMMQNKAERTIVEDNFAIINGALSFSKDTVEKLLAIDNNNNKRNSQPTRPPTGTMQELAFKGGLISNAVNLLVRRTENTDDSVKNLDARMADALKNQARRIREKIDGLDDTTSKNLDNYFKDANANFVRLESLIKSSEATHAGKLGDALAVLDKKISVETLDAKLSGIETKIEANVRRIIEADTVKRANMLNDISKKLKEHEGHSDDKFLVTNNRVGELSSKIDKALETQTFQKEKLRIYQRLTQLKGRMEDLFKKSEDYMEYKKAQVLVAEKNKMESLGMQDDIQKLKQKNQLSGSLLNATALLEKIDPHKICELDAASTRHTTQIAKLEKSLLDFAHDLEVKSISEGGKKGTGTAGGDRSGLGAEEVRKYIKDYLNNMDFESNLKKLQKDLNETAKKMEVVNELEKKFYIHMKEFDFGAVTRDIKRKCNEDETRKEFRITGGRIDQLHEFIKLIRKDVDTLVEFMKRSEYKSSTETPDNAILTGKKLYPVNCISCNPSSKRVNSTSYMGYLNRTVRTPKPENGSIDVGEWSKDEDAPYRRVSLSGYKRR